MAYNYENIPMLSKVKIGEQIYYLKDAEVRSILDTFGNAVTYTVDTTVTPESAHLVTSAAIASYVDEKLNTVAGALTFKGLVEELPLVGSDGDVVLLGTAEYIYYDGEWHLFGDEGVYLTISRAESTYVKKTLTIAGIDLKDAITAEELKTALGLGELAYKTTASGTITNLVTGIEDSTYTPAGEVAVELGYGSTTMTSAGSFTPAGNVTGNVTAAGTVSITRDDANGIAISGTVAAPTVTVTPATTQVQHLESVGELPTYTAAQYVAPSVTEVKGSFASEGMIAKVDTKDTELLVLTPATKTEALTSTGFNAGSYTEASFDQGKLPVLGNAQTVVTGIEKVEASAPAFTGDKFGASFAGTQVEIAANFAGTEGTISVNGQYDRANVKSATFTGTEATMSHTVTYGDRSVTVQ